jgi:hypothetical protein
LGTVRLNERVAGAFTIVNDTDRTISLFDPFKSCSCTEANVERRTLAPGERCSLTVACRRERGGGSGPKPSA